jgi:predicted MFS family arabinose efflux permease
MRTCWRSLKSARYQMYHALALLAMGWAQTRWPGIGGGAVLGDVVVKAASPLMLGWIRAICQGLALGLLLLGQRQRGDSAGHDATQVAARLEKRLGAKNHGVSL